MISELTCDTFCFPFLFLCYLYKLELISLHFTCLLLNEWVKLPGGLINNSETSQLQREHGERTRCSLKQIIRNKQKPITCSLPHPPAPPHHPPKCKNFSRWRRYPAAINSRKYEKRKEQHQQNRGMKFHREGENEK